MADIDKALRELEACRGRPAAPAEERLAYLESLGAGELADESALELHDGPLAARGCVEPKLRDSAARRRGEPPSLERRQRLRSRS